MKFASRRQRKDLRAFQSQQEQSEGQSRERGLTVFLEESSPLYARDV